MQGARLIGIDCAARPNNTWMAVGDLSPDGLLELGPVPRAMQTFDKLAEAVVGAIDGDRATVIALDAPLGWPASLPSALADHRAGAPLVDDADKLLRRDTENRLRGAPYRLNPLEVAGDKIARAAVSALLLMDLIRQRYEQSSENAPPQLFWPQPNTPLPGEGACFIEVYPAATLRALGLPHTGYKGNESKHSDQRTNVIAGLKAKGCKLSPEAVTTACASDNALDACVAAFAAADVVLGKCASPPDDPSIRREGWIWVRRMKS